MWTPDSPELDGNYNGFSERKIRFIKEILCIFQHFRCNVSDSEKQNQYNYMTSIDGVVFNRPEYTFYIRPYISDSERGIYVQVSKKDNNIEKFLFGLYIYQKNDSDVLEHLTHHMNGPAQPLSGDDDYF